MPTTGHITKWIEAVRPWIEQKYGPLPQFSVKPGWWTADVPWHIEGDVRNNIWVFWYHPRWFEKNKFPYAASGSYNDKYTGYIMYALIHDIFHLYQQGPTQKELGKIWHYLPTRMTPLLVYWLYYQQWAEGTAELCTWQFCFERINNEVSDVPTKNPGFDEFINAMFTEEYKNSLVKYISGRFARNICGLFIAGLISEISVASLKLPFEIPRCIKEEIQKMLSNPIDSKKPDRWFLAAYKCASALIRESMSLRELLVTPLTNKELVKLFKKDIA